METDGVQSVEIGGKFLVCHSSLACDKFGDIFFDIRVDNRGQVGNGCILFIGKELDNRIVLIGYLRRYDILLTASVARRRTAILTVFKQVIAEAT